MQKDQSDLGLIFKKRARRRLVGAIALVLLMIILLPIVLEDRAEVSSPQEIAIVMPDGDVSDEVVVSEELITIDDLKATKTDEVKPEPLVLPKPKAEKTNTKDVVPATKQKVAVKSTAEVKSKPVVKEKSKAPAETKPKPTAATEKKTEAKAPTKKEAPVKSEPISATGKFYVQIGVFSNIDNVKKLQVKLDELGYQSVTEKMQSATGDKTRLRTASFDGRNEAAIALENIKDAGLTGMVVSQK